MILEGDITIPYKRTTGAAVGRFLAELKENARLVGARCDGCGKVYAPPVDVCGECYKPLTDWVPLSGAGTVIAITHVARSMPWSPVAAPYSLGLVRLDGADTCLLHLVGPNLKAGDRVAAVFKIERSGTLLDIERFASAETVSAPLDAAELSAYESLAAESEIPPNSPTGGTSTPMQRVHEVSTVFYALSSRFRRERVEEHLSYYFSIDDEQWTVLITMDACVVQPGKTVDKADCFLKTSREIFLGVINGTYTPSMTDLVKGRVKTNNPFLLQKFLELFL
jgi:uncharacterized OB-fold protein